MQRIVLICRALPTVQGLEGHILPTMHCRLTSDRGLLAELAGLGRDQARMGQIGGKKGQIAVALVYTESGNPSPSQAHTP